MADPRRRQPRHGRRLGGRQGAVALRALQRRRLRDLDDERQAAREDPCRERPARALRLAAAGPLLPRAHRDSSLGAEPARPNRARRPGRRAATSSARPGTRRAGAWRRRRRSSPDLRARTNTTSSCCWRAAGKPLCWFIVRITVPSARGRALGRDRVLVEGHGGRVDERALDGPAAARGDAEVRLDRGRSRRDDARRHRLLVDREARRAARGRRSRSCRFRSGTLVAAGVGAAVRRP